MLFRPQNIGGIFLRVTDENGVYIPLGAFIDPGVFSAIEEIRTVQQARNICEAADILRQSMTERDRQIELQAFNMTRGKG